METADVARHFSPAISRPPFFAPNNSLLLCLLIGLTAVPVAAKPKPPAPATPDTLLTPWLLAGQEDRDRLLADLQAKPAQPPTDRILSLLTQAQASLRKPALADKRAALDQAYTAALAAQG